MKHSPLNARRARAALWPAAAAAVLVAAAWLASARYQPTHAGTALFFKASLAEGAIVLQWLLPSPDGSRSGFGNPGWAPASQAHGHPADLTPRRSRPSPRRSRSAPPRVAPRPDTACAAATTSPGSRHAPSVAARRFPDRGP